MNRSAIDLWVGIFVALGIGAVLFLALKVGNLVTLDRAPGYRLEARFDNIGGLKLRAAVKAAGVVVGRVEGVRLDPQTYEAVTTLRIDREYQFTKDTIASINTSGVLGEVYVGLDAGGDTAMLKDGDRIAKTQSAMVLEKLIGQFLFDKAQESRPQELKPEEPKPQEPKPQEPKPQEPKSQQSGGTSVGRGAPQGVKK